jgi:hypothetical protein
MQGGQKEKRKCSRWVRSADPKINTTNDGWMERWCWTAYTGKQQVRKDTNDVFVGQEEWQKTFVVFKK